MSGWAQGARLVAPQFAIPAPWMGLHEQAALGGRLDTSVHRFPIALILLVAVTVLAARRRDREALVLCSLAGTLVARLVDRRVAHRRTPVLYLLRWAWVARRDRVARGRCGRVGGSCPSGGGRARDITLTVTATAACVLAVLIVVSASRAAYPEYKESTTIEPPPIAGARIAAPAPRHRS